MPLSVFAADEQTDHPVETLRWIRLAEAVLADEGVRGETEVSILFVDEPTIADLNQRFLGKEGPTDVLSFPIDEEPVEGGRSPDSGGTGPGYNPSPEEAPTLLGDVVICPAVAARNAPEHAGSYDDELALLLVHGLLHLLGLDHEAADEAEIMEAKERELLARHHGHVPEAAYARSGEPSPPASTPAAGAGARPAADGASAGTPPVSDGPARATGSDGRTGRPEGGADPGDGPPDEGRPR